MTIDEAIKDIKDNIKPVVGGISLDMAIEALEFRERYDYFWEEVKIRRHEGERDRDSPQRKSVQNQGGGAMKTAIAKPLSAVITIISFIVLFLSHDEVVVGISAYVFLVGVSVLLATTVIDMVEGR